MTTIMHVNLDTFYASVEMARRPELRTVPMFVGGSTRGVVLSANALARSYGIDAGMPATHARRLCPHVTMVSPDLEKYAAVSTAIEEIFATCTNAVEMTGADEAFLDITAALRRLGGDPHRIAEQLRAQITDEQGITASVGIGPTKFVAKLASTVAKPDGIKSVLADEVISFVHPQPVEALWGVGPRTAEQLRHLGLRTVRDIAHTSRYTLQRALGIRRGDRLFDLAWGKDEQTVSVSKPAERSVGFQQRFTHDIDDSDEIITELLRIAERTTAQMRTQAVVGQNVTLSLRFSDFTDITRSGTLHSPTDVTKDIHTEAVRLFQGLHLQRARIRRVGVRVGKLVPTAHSYRQPTLDESEHRWSDAERAIDKAVLRFGPRAVSRARLTRLKSGG